MITINYQPVLALENESKIVFTDSAKSEPSYVYMDKFIAPSSSELVWMEIRNPNYDPDDPNNSQPAYVVNLDNAGKFHSKTEYLDHPDNPLFLFQKWMWLENVLSNHFPANYIKDADGNPITNEDGSLDLGDWQTRPGIVKLELYEHKHVLTRQASLDNANILHRLSFILSRYNELAPTRLLNKLSWEDIAEFLSLRKIKLDYGIIYSDDTGTLPSEYPPVVPHHCLWKSQTLRFCLQNLLENFEGRLLSETLVSPDPEDYLANGQDAANLDAADVLTSMKWRYRRPIEYREDIIYEKSIWPVDSLNALEDEQNSVILYRKLEDYYGATTLYNPGFVERTITQSPIINYQYSKRSNYDLICNLYPYHSDYQLLEFDQLSQYLKKAHVNMATEYCFSTKALPPDFYSKSEWSSITLKFTNTNYEYLVEHKKRNTANPYGTRTGTGFTKGAFNIAFKAVVKENLVTNGMVFSSFVDITNNLIIEDELSLPIVDADANPHDVIHGVISGNDFIVINRTSLIPTSIEENEIIDIRFEGNLVDKIIWSLDSFNPAIPDSQLEIADPNSYEKVHNYVYEGFTNYDDDKPFEILEYQTNVSSQRTTNLFFPESENLATINFVMRVPEEERKQAIIDYLTRPVFSTINEVQIENELYNDALAEKWLLYYERIQIKIGINHDSTELSFYHYEYEPKRLRTSKGIHPDLLPSQFGVTTFPDTIPGTPAPPPPTYYIGSRGTLFPNSLNTIRRDLANSYIAYLNSFDKTVNLTYRT